MSSDSEVEVIEEKSVIQVENVTETTTVEPEPEPEPEDEDNPLTRVEGYINTCISYRKEHRDGYDMRTEDRHTRYNLDKTHEVLFCPTLYSGSISLMQLLALANGADQSQVEEVSKLPEIDQIQNFSTYIPTPTYSNLYENLQRTDPIMMVRHPFNRLVTVYKLLKDATEGPLQEAKNEIIRTLQQTGEIEDNEPSLAFAHVVHFLIGLDEYFQCPDYLQYFCSFELQCEPCWMDFKYIIKYETFEKDIEFLKSSNYLEPDTKLFDSIVKPDYQEDDVMDFYKELSSEDVEELYNFFREDMKTFGYSQVEYLPK